MRSRFAHLGIVAVCLAALLGLTTPPAHATSAVVLEFNGAAQLDGPLGYPCSPSNSKLCPQGFPNPIGPGGTFLALTTNSLPLTVLDTFPTTVELGMLPYIHGGQTRAFAFGSFVCVLAGVNAVKAGKPIVHANAGCSISATGVIAGWCWLSTGKLSGTVTDGLGQTYFIDLHWYEAVLMTISGHWAKANGQTGLLRGILNASAIPDNSTTPPGNSCSALTATQFLVSGTVVLAGLNA